MIRARTCVLFVCRPHPSGQPSRRCRRLRLSPAVRDEEPPSLPPIVLPPMSRVPRLANGSTMELKPFSTPTRRSRTVRYKCHVRCPYQPFRCAAHPMARKGVTGRQAIDCWQSWLAIPAYAVFGTKRPPVQIRPPRQENGRSQGTSWPAVCITRSPVSDFGSPLGANTGNGGP